MRKLPAFHIQRTGAWQCLLATLCLLVGLAASAPAPPALAQSAQRISFAPGATSATVYGVTPQDYVLKALRGQTMIVELFTSGGVPAHVRIEAAGGGPLGSASESFSWSGVLPATQDYYLRVSSPAAAAPPASRYA